jgi:hypothetical protein
MADHHHIRWFLFASIASHPIGVDRMEALNFCCVVPAIDVRIIDRAVAPALCLPGNNNKLIKPCGFFQALRLLKFMPLSYR